MANEEHVAILKEGAEAWNKWSFERWKTIWNSDQEIYFSIADLTGADLSGIDLSYLDVGSTNFGDANLTGANLSGANFEETNFENANLERGNLFEAELMGATLVGANLRGANLTRAGLVRVNLSRANLDGVNLSNAYLQKANLSETNLSGAILNGTEYDNDTVWPDKFVPPPEAIKADYWTIKSTGSSSTVSVIEYDGSINQPNISLMFQIRKDLQVDFLPAILAGGIVGGFFLVGGILGGIPSGLVVRVGFWMTLATVCLMAFLSYADAAFEKERPKKSINPKVSGRRVAELSSRWWTSRAITTIISQVFGGFFCLMIGAVIIRLITGWMNSWSAYWSDGSQHDFFMTGWFIGLGLIVLVGVVSWKQFQYSLDQVAIFKLTKKYTKFIFVSILILIIFTLIVVDPSFSVLISEIVAYLIISPLLAVTVGSVTIVRLRIEGFDCDEHAWLINNDTDVETCKLGTLPYRHKVMGFWRAFALVVFFLILGCAMAFPIFSEGKSTGSAVGFIAGFAMLIAIGYWINSEISFLSTKEFFRIQGFVKKEKTKGISFIKCEHKYFITDAETWDRVIDGRIYILWFSPQSNHSGRVIAFESLN